MHVNGDGWLGVWLVALLLMPGVSAGNTDLRLVEAIKKKDLETARVLVKQGVDVNTASGDGSTALHWAAHWDDLNTADLLIAAGAAPNAANDNGVTPLSLACTNGSVAMAERLLKAGANPNTATRTGKTILMTAAQTGSAALVKLLLTRGADVQAKEHLKGQTALMWAASEEHSEVVRILIEHGADIRARSQDGFTPLLFAARQGDSASVRMLIAAGVDVNEISALNDPSAMPARAATRKPSVLHADALGIAVGSDQAALAEVLLDLGANPNASGLGFTALHYAVHMRDEALVKALLARGADPNARITTDVPRRGGAGMPMAGATPFLMAAKAGDLDMMRLLLSNGADPLIPTQNGTTPLMVAAGVGWVEGQDRRRQGQRVILLDMVAEEAISLETVKLTMELGGSVQAVNDFGETALHGAAHMGANSIVSLLVAKGAEVDAHNKYGQTPWRLAEGFYVGGAFVSHQSTAELLLKLGADPARGGPSFTSINR